MIEATLAFRSRLRNLLFDDLRFNAVRQGADHIDMMGWPAYLVQVTETGAVPLRTIDPEDICCITAAGAWRGSYIYQGMKEIEQQCFIGKHSGKWELLSKLLMQYEIFLVVCGLQINLR